MNKILFSLMLLFAVVACKKDDADQDKSIKPSDAQRVAASITVRNSENQAGNLPAPGATITLFPFTAPIKTIAGKYAVIIPGFQAGSATGYFLQVKGASGYFKVNATVSSGHIIIQLPENIETGSFTISVSAFDANNNASNIVDAVIEVVTPGGTGGDVFTGTWKLSGKLKINGNWDRNLYERRDGNLTVYHCFNDRLQPYSNMNAQLPTVYVAVQQYHLLNAELVFDAKGMVVQDYRDNSYLLNFGASTCNSLAYDPDPTGNIYIQGPNAWNYNASTSTISMLYKYDTPGAEIWPTYSEELEVTEISATKMIVKHKDYGYTWEYSKQ